ncbi:hypothetical protein [Sediminibacter sp. Hel_I_10]|uniref:hypothetical protein n=1 Tax=Sediminibacter sp. Hel_I_10 TaxID=1392490 RepID=UPI0006905A12|nr:hypothetical protein [Sediminibacter sp. Hel_I_10]
MKRNKFFSLPDAKPTPIEQASVSGSFVSKYLLAHYQKVSSIKKELTRLPEAEEFFFLQSEKSFNAFTFIPVVLENQSAKHLLATTYSINKRVINALVELHQTGKVDEITLLVSDTMLSRNMMICDLLSTVNRQYANINVLFGWNHSKVCLIETKEANYIIEGSGNWSENASLEQYIFANSKGLFDFRMKLFTESEIRYRAINGEIVKS